MTKTTAEYIRLSDVQRVMQWEHDNEVWEVDEDGMKHLEECAVEAAPVIHAVWIPRPDIADCTYECSHCGKIRDAYCDDDDVFCSRCGAMMKDELC